MTVQEIAKRAAVSVATVSRTINRVSTVDPVLARRVWKVIEQVGYYPNIHARALVSGRSRVFGLMIAETIRHFSLIGEPVVTCVRDGCDPCSMRKVPRSQVRRLPCAGEVPEKRFG